MKKELGEGYTVINEGLNGRTTVWDDPIEEEKNGKAHIGPIMDTHAPLDLMIIFLGTNDLKKRFGASEFDIAAGAGGNPSKEDVVKKIMDMTDGYGCDIYIEATGHASSVQQGLDMIRKLGRFVEFSVFGSPATVDWSVIGDEKELDILGAHLSPYCFPFVIEHIEKGVLKTEGVVSRFFPIEKWEEAFEYATGQFGDLKTAIKF